MTKLSHPEINATLLSADTIVQNEEQRVLIIGMPDTATYDSGTISDGQLLEDYLGDEDADFGQRSILAGMIREFKIANSASGRAEDHITKFDVLVLLEDAGGTAHVNQITFTGNATSAGYIDYCIGSVSNQTVRRVVIPDSAPPSAIGPILVTNIGNSDASDDLPYTFSSTATGLEMTCVHKGELNSGFWFDIQTPGISKLVADTKTPGATNPDMTGVFDDLQRRYQTVVWPFAPLDDTSITADTVSVADWLDARFNEDGDIMDGVAIAIGSMTYAEAIDGTHAPNTVYNSKSLAMGFLLYNETQEEGPVVSPLEIPWEMSARVAGIRARRLTQGHGISDLVVANASLDQFGGPHMASFPYHNTPIESSDPLYVRDSAGALSKAQQKALRDVGYFLIGQNPAGSDHIIGEIRTTYKTDAAGNTDDTWKFLNYVDTGSNAREYFYNNVRKRYAQSRLTEGKIIRGHEQENAASISAYIDKLYGDLTGRGYVLTQAGEAALVFFKDNKTVDIDLLTGDVTIAMKLPIVTQIRTIIIPIQMAFSIEEA